MKPYHGTDANVMATRAAHRAVLSMDQSVDIINAASDELIVQDVELREFSTLDRITGQIDAKIQMRLFRRVARPNACSALRKARHWESRWT